MEIAIWWIRRDLRLRDNPALEEASRGKRVLPLFILDPILLSHPAEKRKSFLFEGLRSLADAIAARGGQLLVREGNPVEVLQTTMAESGAASIYAEEDFTPYARRRDGLVAARLPLRLIHGLTVQPPLAVTKPDGTPYTVFTPFSKAWKALPLPAPRQINSGTAFISQRFHSLPIPFEREPVTFPAGEAEAERRLTQFLERRVYSYQEDRNRMDLEGTSTLSPYLRFGMLSARVAAHHALEAMALAPDGAARRSAETWLNELIWREFYHAILYHFPHVAREAFNPAMRSIAWRVAPRELQAWQEGLTGYPVVDAAMRQLREIGWMHNRARMIVASFLSKDLLINWQEGERWFMRHLVDGDIAANNGGWQWTAGVGTDAAPYFRIFNPVLQSAKFDPRGDYIRRWVPELEHVPEEFIHEPWRMTPQQQRECHCIMARDYPAPLVDHTFARQRALNTYRR